MSHFKFVHEINADPAAFWENFFDDAYNEELHKHVNVRERQFLDLKDDGVTKSWTLRVFPQRDLPDFVKKVVKGDLGYIEYGVMKKGSNRIDSRIEPTLFKDKTKISASFSIEPIAPGKVRRTFEGDVEVSFPLVGGKVEKLILADMEKAYDQIAAFTNEWLATHG